MPASTTRRRLVAPASASSGGDTYVAADVPVDDRMRVGRGARGARRGRRRHGGGPTSSGWTPPPGTRPIELVVGPRHVRARSPGADSAAGRARRARGHAVDGVTVTSPMRTAVDLASRSTTTRACRRRCAGARVRVPPRAAARPPGRSRQPARARRMVPPWSRTPTRGPSRRRRPGSRLILRAAPGSTPDPQLVVYDDVGRVRRARRLRVARLRTALEYQGDHHRTDAQQWRRDAVAHHRARGVRLARSSRSRSDDLFVDPTGSSTGSAWPSRSGLASSASPSRDHQGGRHPRERLRRSLCGLRDHRQAATPDRRGDRP